MTLQNRSNHTIALLLLHDRTLQQSQIYVSYFLKSRCLFSFTTKQYYFRGIKILEFYLNLTDNCNIFQFRSTSTYIEFTFKMKYFKVIVDKLFWLETTSYNFLVADSTCMTIHAKQKITKFDFIFYCPLLINVKNILNGKTDSSV